MRGDGPVLARQCQGSRKFTLGRVLCRRLQYASCDLRGRRHNRSGMGGSAVCPTFRDVLRVLRQQSLLPNQPDRQHIRRDRVRVACQFCLPGKGISIRTITKEAQIA